LRPAREPDLRQAFIRPVDHLGSPDGEGLALQPQAIAAAFSAAASASSFLAIGDKTQGAERAFVSLSFRQDGGTRRVNHQQRRDVREESPRTDHVAVVQTPKAPSFGR